MTSTPPNAIDIVLKQILDKISKLEERTGEGLNTLSKENERRAAEIRALGEQLKMQAITEDDGSIIGDGDTGSYHYPNNIDPEISEIASRTTNIRSNLPRESNNNTQSKMKAVDVVRTIEPLKGKDDLGVEDFIKAVKYARGICAEPELLIRLIIAEKIIEQAKRSIRYISIGTYEELYEALRQNISIPTTVGNCRAKLHDIRQGPTESVQSYNLRFRQQLNELYYAVQNKHNRPTARRIAMEEEEDGATRTYVLNLRPDIGRLVIPSHPKTLAEAQHMATDMEMWVKDAHQQQNRRFSTSTPTSNNKPRETHRTDPPLHDKSLAQRMNLKCNKCGRIGHTQERCFARNFPVTQPGKLPPKINHIKEDEESTPEDMTKNQYEYTTPEDSCNTSSAAYTACHNTEDYYSTQEQE
ncbi:hypothetical protein ANTPLA_LOCUS7682 [Anthophora plagiata]